MKKIQDLNLEKRIITITLEHICRKDTRRFATLNKNNETIRRSEKQKIKRNYIENISKHMQEKNLQALSSQKNNFKVLHAQQGEELQRFANFYIQPLEPSGDWREKD